MFASKPPVPRALIKYLIFTEKKKKRRKICPRPVQVVFPLIYLNYAKQGPPSSWYLDLPETSSGDANSKARILIP